MEPGKIFAIGDIHGCGEKLSSLLRVLPASPEDVLVFLGDYINRGPKSREVIDILLDVKRRFPRTVFLMGNHEHALLKYARSGDPDDLRMLRPYSVEATLKSYGTDQVRMLRDLEFLPAAHRSFLQDLLPYHEVEEYLFTHAGIVPGEDLEHCPLDLLLSVRAPFLEFPGLFEKTVVFGHTPFLTPLVSFDRIGIDTGAAYGNLLTALELPSLSFYHA